MFYRGYRVTMTKRRGSRRVTVTREYDGLANWVIVVALLVIVWILKN